MANGEGGMLGSAVCYPDTAVCCPSVFLSVSWGRVAAGRASLSLDVGVVLA